MPAFILTKPLDEISENDMKTGHLMLSEQGRMSKTKALERLKKLAQKVADSITANQKHPSYCFKRFNDSIISWEQRLANLDTDFETEKEKLIRKLEEEFATRKKKYEEHLNISLKRLEEEKKHLLMTKTDTKQILAFENAKRDFEALYGKCSITIPGLDTTESTSVQIKMESEEVPMVQIQGVGVVPLTHAELREESSMAKLRADAYREIEQRKRKEEEDLLAARERAEQERRIRDEQERQRQEKQRQEELVERERQEREGIKPQNTPFVTNHKINWEEEENDEDKESVNSWTSEDDRRVAELTRIRREKYEQWKREQKEKEEAARAARRLELEAQGGEEEVSFADFMHDGAFRPAPPASAPQAQAQAQPQAPKPQTIPSYTNPYTASAHELFDPSIKFSSEQTKQMIKEVQARPPFTHKARVSLDIPPPAMKKAKKTVQIRPVGKEVGPGVVTYGIPRED